MTTPEQTKPTENENTTPLNLSPMETALLRFLQESEAGQSKRFNELECLLRSLLTAYNKAAEAHRTMATQYQALASEVRQLRALAASFAENLTDGNA